MSKKSKSSVPTAEVAKEDGDELAKEGNALSENDLDKVVGGATLATEPVPNDGVPTESLSLNFTKISYDYTKQTRDGSVGGNVSGSYDLGKAGKS
jgi:hypothetical protein